MHTLVPGRDPIDLVCWYPEFEEYYPRCEMQTKQWLVQHVQCDWTCIDAGANLGYFSILLAQLAPLGRVFAFEPTSTFEMLVRNIDYGQILNVVPERLGLGARCWVGAEPIFRIWGQKAEQTHVEFVTIDAYVAQQHVERIDFIKVDVDGFDLEVLWGAQTTLDTWSPIVLVELSQALSLRGHAIADAFRYMLDRGYGHALVLDGENYLFTKSSTQKASSGGLLNIDPGSGDSLPVGDVYRLENVKRIEAVETRLHNAATRIDARTYSIDGPAWDYCLEVLIDSLETDEISGIEVQLVLVAGGLGVALYDSGSCQLIGPEAIYTRPGQVIFVEEAHKPTLSLMLRKTTSAPLQFILEEVGAGLIVSGHMGG